MLLGSSKSGKSSVVHRFAESRYNGDGSNVYVPTCGAFFITKRIQTSNGITCKVQVWDTAGQAQYRSMAPMYYKSAAAAIVCYDARDRESYDSMREWLEELHRNVPAGNIVLAVAATKCDDDEQPTIPLREAVEFAHSQGAFHATTSAKMNLGINELFQHVAERVLRFRSDMACSIPVTPGATTSSAMSDYNQVDQNHALPNNRKKKYSNVPTNRSLFYDDDESEETSNQLEYSYNNIGRIASMEERIQPPKLGRVRSIGYIQDLSDREIMKAKSEAINSSNDQNDNLSQNDNAKQANLSMCDLGPSMCGIFSHSFPNTEKSNDSKTDLSSCLIS